MKNDPIGDQLIEDQMRTPSQPRRMSYDERVAMELAERDKLFIVEHPPQDEYIFDPWLNRKTAKKWDPDIPFEDPPRFSLARVLAISSIGTLLAVAGILIWNVAHAESITVMDRTSVQVLATVTAYTSSVDETDDTPTTTASGTATHPGTIACPQTLPFGTHVEIRGRTYTCEDRMAARYADRYDVWMESKDEARAFGIQRVIVSIN